MDLTSLERFIERLNCQVYPITLFKFLVNKRRIQSYFSKAADRSFQIRDWKKFNLDTESCELCKQKKSKGILCRQHTSIDRVLTANHVAFDLDTNTYFYKNEIFRMVGDRLVIVYCPHSKLITGDITDAKVRKINPITVEDSSLDALPEYQKVHEFISSDLLDLNMSCWFNRQFSIVTVPEDRNYSNWCLIPNK